MNDISLLEPLPRNETEINQDFLHSMQRGPKRRQYRAASNYLRQAKILLIAVNNLLLESRRAELLLEAIYHLCEAQDYDMCLATLRALVDEKTNLSLYSHLLYRGKSKRLLDLTELLLSRFQTVDDRQYFLKILQAKSFESLGQRSEAIQIYEKICAEEPSTSLEYVEAFSRLAGCQVQMGNYDIGIPNIEEALARIEKLDFRRVDIEADLIEHLAFYRMNSGNLDEASRLFETVLKLREKENIVTALVNPLGHQGIVSRKRAASQKYLIRLLVSNFLHLLRLPYMAKLFFDKFCEPLMPELNENYAKAESLFNQAYDLSDEIGDENVKSWVSHHLAWVLINKGQAISAESYALQALETYKKIGDRRGLSDCHEQLGRIYLAVDNKNTDAAKSHFSQSLNIRNEIGNLHGAASSTLNFSFLYWHTGNYFKSVRFLLKGMKKYREVGLLNPKRILAITILFSVWTVGKRDWTL
jgi:tetratricopeptide (TPR) repeat protein